MRIHKLTTYLQAEEVFTLVEFLDQLRDVLIQAYGDDISAMLQQASAPRTSTEIAGDEDAF